MVLKKGFSVCSAISETQLHCTNLQSALSRSDIVAAKIQVELTTSGFEGPFSSRLFQISIFTIMFM
jgi:hypothetical protein